MSDDKKYDLKEITKLEREIEELERELTLVRKEEDIIKEYEMVEGDYTIMVTVYEANELEPRGTNFWLFKTEKTACDAFV